MTGVPVGIAGVRLASMHRAIRIGLLTAVIYAVNAYLSFVC
jgi:hypothetical protein